MFSNIAVASSTRVIYDIMSSPSAMSVRRNLRTQVAIIAKKQAQLKEAQKEAIEAKEEAWKLFKERNQQLEKELVELGAAH